MKFDAIVIGGGLAGVTAAKCLMDKGMKCALVSEGHSLRDVDYNALSKAGCSLFIGEKVLSADVVDSRVEALHCLRLEDETLEAKYFILASGKYFSKGIVADMSRVYEPVFNLEVEYDEDKSSWFDYDFKNEQKFMNFGVRNYGNGRVSLEGMLLSNLFAAGEVLAGISGIESNANEIIINSAIEAVSNIR